MKNDKILILLLLMSVLSACSVKSTNSKRKSTTSTSTSGTSTVDGSTDGSTDSTDPTSATSTYFTIPNIIASGGTYGQTWWSSKTYVEQNSRDENEFTTDKIFNVRIIPRSPSQTVSKKSTFDRLCSQNLLHSTKVQVDLTLHIDGVSVGETATLSSSIDVPSKVWRFRVPKSNLPLVLEVINVTSDSACRAYGSPPANCTFVKIPVNASPWPTECVAFDIQYSTDWTTDLPGVRAN